MARTAPSEVAARKARAKAEASARREPDAPHNRVPVDLKIEALRLRAAGWSWREISERLGRNTQVIQRWVDAELDALVVPEVIRMRQLHTLRLEHMLRYLQPRIERGDDKAVNAGVRVIESIRRLWGVDAPVQAQVTHTVKTEADIELEEMLNEAAARNAVMDQQLGRLDDHS